MTIDRFIVLAPDTSMVQLENVTFFLHDQWLETFIELFGSSGAHSAIVKLSDKDVTFFKTLANYFQVKVYKLDRKSVV